VTLVFGGDYAWGPFPAETVDRIRSLDALAIRGNADRDPGDDWVVDRLGPERFDWLQSLPEQLEVEVDGVGRVLFCHGSPRSDEEIILRTTPDEWLREMVADVDADVVVCGHTHMQFDRSVDGIRVLNAGSVGLAYGAPGAHWLALGPGIEHRRTSYDEDAFADRVAGLSWPIATRFAEESIRKTRTEEATLEFFERMAAEQRGQRYLGPS
jgi:predicted phosphodiesterase